MDRPIHCNPQGKTNPTAFEMSAAQYAARQRATHIVKLDPTQDYNDLFKQLRSEITRNPGELEAAVVEYKVFLEEYAKNNPCSGRADDMFR